MEKRRSHIHILLIVIFLILQLGGQTAAGFSGRAGGLFNFYTLISYCFLVCRAFVWLLVLREIPLTAAYPFTGVVYLLILPLSILVFGEAPDWKNFTGAVLIFTGIIFTAVGASKNV